MKIHNNPRVERVLIIVFEFDIINVPFLGSMTGLKLKLKLKYANFSRLSMTKLKLK